MMSVRHAANAIGSDASIGTPSHIVGRVTARKSVSSLSFSSSIPAHSRAASDGIDDPLRAEYDEDADDNGDQEHQDRPPGEEHETHDDDGDNRDHYSESAVQPGLIVRGHQLTDIGRP